MAASLPMLFIEEAAQRRLTFVFFLNIDENKTHMEENKFARLKAALQQAKEACEISPEEKEFQQEYELAKEALKQAQKEVHAGITLYLFVISLYTEAKGGNSGIERETSGWSHLPPKKAGLAS